MSPTTQSPDLTPDELLSTTRAVRRRLDLSRSVEREVLEGDELRALLGRERSAEPGPAEPVSQR